MEILTSLILAFVCILTIYLWLGRHDPKLPPCPATPLPIVGHLFHLGSNPRTLLKQWRKKCGDIYSLYFGPNLVVVINGYDLHKELLLKNADIFSDRPRLLVDFAVGQGSGNGVSFASGHLWKENRTATVTILRALGMGKVSMVEKISEVATINNELIANLKGAATDLNEIISFSVANVISSIIMGHSFSFNDKTFPKINSYVRQNFEDATFHNFANYFPFLLKFPGDYFRAKKIHQRAHYIMDTFLDPFIEEKTTKPLDEQDMNDFISHYIFHRNKKLTAGQSTYMDDVNLKKVIYDLFIAGMDTTSNSIIWTILYFLHYPEVQDKIYREIENQIGLDRPPTMSDSGKLPYTNAYIKELLRITSLVPWGVMHLCTETTTVRGYTIPKGTYILPNLDSILYDKDIWGEDVFTLRPERFLDGNGKVKNPEQLVPFSVGRRMCPGEALAKMELFLLLTRMVQRFKFLPVDPEALPPLTAIFGITTFPFPFKVRAVDRKDTGVC